MKRLLIIAVALLVACGSGEQKIASTKAELEKLRAEYSAMGERIRELEQWLGAEAHQGSEVKYVKVDSIRLQEFARRVNIQGKVDGDEIVTLNPRSSGEVVWLNATVGQSVRAGQVLARVDDAIMRKALEELETGYSLAKTVYERQAALWRDSIGSEIQYIQAKNQKEAIEKRIASTRQQMELNLIKSPINGTIDVLNMKMGQLVSPAQPVAVLINLSKLKIVAEVSESYSNSVKKGDKVSVFFPDIDKSYDLPITSVSNFIDPRNRTFLLEAKLPGGIVDVKANMLAKVSIESYKIKDAMIVPVNVVFKNNQGEYLYILSTENEKTFAKKRTVKTGLISDSNVEILEGLTVGDQIITDGYQSLEDGISVQVQK